MAGQQGLHRRASSAAARPPGSGAPPLPGKVVARTARLLSACHPDGSQEERSGRVHIAGHWQAAQGAPPPAAGGRAARPPDGRLAWHADTRLPSGMGPLLRHPRNLSAGPRPRKLGSLFVQERAAPGQFPALPILAHRPRPEPRRAGHMAERTALGGVAHQRRRPAPGTTPEPLHSPSCCLDPLRRWLGLQGVLAAPSLHHAANAGALLGPREEDCAP